MAVAIVVLAVSPATAQSPVETFPLTEGTYWVYEGTTRSQGVDQQAETQHVTCRMEVTRTIRRGAMTVAVVTGYPGDLPWSDSDAGDFENLLVRTASGDYYLVSGVTPDEVFDASNDLAKLPEFLTDRAELVLDTPLTPGKSYAPMEPEIERDDTWYAWHVDSRRQAHLSRVRGVSRSRLVTKYRLALRTLPDHIIVEFVPGIGVSRYIYSHHGTVMDVDMRLVRFHRGA